MEYRKLTDLHKLPNNPRVIRDKQFKALCDSIRHNRAYFEARPLILSDRTAELVIIAGNQRYEAAKAIGLAEVPTFLIHGLTAEQEREITIKDNAHLGEWDWDSLANEFSDLPLADWGLDLPADWLTDGQSVLGASDTVDMKDRAGSSPWSRVVGSDTARVLIGDMEFGIAREFAKRFMRALQADGRPLTDVAREIIERWIDTFPS